MKEFVLTRLLNIRAMTPPARPPTTSAPKYLTHAHSSPPNNPLMLTPNHVLIEQSSHSSIAHQAASRKSQEELDTLPEKYHPQSQGHRRPRDQFECPVGDI
ncbi:hypothetical protein L0F63_006131 [Massospora cicadina]|nr:hypothetical protein L0F63_006131 [Massospora cicadina]